MLNEYGIEEEGIPAIAYFAFCIWYFASNLSNQING